MASPRLLQLFLGLALYGVSLAMMVRADLGLDPWDVFHQGVARRTGLSFGTVVIATGAAVLLLWVPLRQRPGVGTVSNVVVLGLVVDLVLAVLGTPASLLGRAALLAGGIALNAVATAAYLGAGLGPGPRDGLMTGLVRCTGGSVRMLRTAIEVAVLAIGWSLGDTVGVGTVLYAVAIGPLVHPLLPVFEFRPATSRPLPDQLAEQSPHVPPGGTHDQVGAGSGPAAGAEAAGAFLVAPAGVPDSLKRDAERIHAAYGLALSDAMLTATVFGLGGVVRGGELRGVRAVRTGAVRRAGSDVRHPRRSAQRCAGTEQGSPEDKVVVRFRCGLRADHRRPRSHGGGAMSP